MYVLQVGFHTDSAVACREEEREQGKHFAYMTTRDINQVIKLISLP